MNVKQRARELLAAEFNADGREQFERGRAVVVTTDSALNAITIALTQQWLPIETASKMAGTSILGWDGYDMLVTCWCDQPHGRGGWYEREDRYETFYWEPTHWMPLPAPPEAP